MRLYTSAEVYAVIHARHSDDLKPFSSFSDPDGTFNGGAGVLGRMETEYGLKNADYPLIGIKSTWPISQTGKALKRSHEYWLCVNQKEE